MPETQEEGGRGGGKGRTKRLIKNNQIFASIYPSSPVRQSASPYHPSRHRWLFCGVETCSRILAPRAGADPAPAEASHATLLIEDGHGRARGGASSGGSVLGGDLQVRRIPLLISLSLSVLSPPPL